MIVEKNGITAEVFSEPEKRAYMLNGWTVAADPAAAAPVREKPLKKPAKTKAAE